MDDFPVLKKILPTDVYEKAMRDKYIEIPIKRKPEYFNQFRYPSDSPITTHIRIFLKGRTLVHERAYGTFWESFCIQRGIDENDTYFEQDDCLLEDMIVAKYLLLTIDPKEFFSTAYPATDNYLA